MSLREAAQMALEALETALETMKDDWYTIDSEWGPSEGGLQAAIDGRLTGYGYFQKTIDAIAALRAALAQQDEPWAQAMDGDGAYIGELQFGGQILKEIRLPAGYCMRIDGNTMYVEELAPIDSVLAERERCARIVEDRGAIGYGSLAIAAVIRTGAKE